MSNHRGVVLVDAETAGAYHPARVGSSRPAIVIGETNMRLILLSFGAAVAALGSSVPASASSTAGAPAPTVRLAATPDACPLAAIPVLGPILCSVLGL